MSPGYTRILPLLHAQARRLSRATTLSATTFLADHAVSTESPSPRRQERPHRASDRPWRALPAEKGFLPSFLGLVRSHACLSVPTAVDLVSHRCTPTTCEIDAGLRSF